MASPHMVRLPDPAMPRTEGCDSPPPVIREGGNASGARAKHRASTHFTYAACECNRDGAHVACQTRALACSNDPQAPPQNGADGGTAAHASEPPCDSARWEHLARSRGGGGRRPARRATIFQVCFKVLVLRCKDILPTPSPPSCVCMCVRERQRETVWETESMV